MVQLYIFDMGGVVSDIAEYLRGISGHLGISLERFRESSVPEIRLLTSGLITEVEFWERWSRASGRSVEADLFARYFRPRNRPRVVEMAMALRGEARVVIGTNTFASHYDIHRRQGDYDGFDAVYSSHLIGVSKPDPEFYRRILEAERCAAGAAALIDDTEANVESARRQGLQALRYTDEAALAGWIARLRREPGRG